MFDRIVVVSLLVVAGFFYQGPQVSRFDAPREPISRTHYEGMLSVRTPAGPAVLQVRLKDWEIENRQQVQLPEGGTMLVEVRSGENVVTIVDGQRSERKDGEYFTVPAGSSMNVETANDTAVFTILAFERR